MATFTLELTVAEGEYVKNLLTAHREACGTGANKICARVIHRIKVGQDYVRGIQQARRDEGRRMRARR